MKTQKQSYFKDDILYLKHGELQFKVKVLEPRPVFGRIDYLVTPVAGQGEQHVNQDNLTKNGS